MARWCTWRSADETVLSSHLCCHIHQWMWKLQGKHNKKQTPNISKGVSLGPSLHWGFGKLRAEDINSVFWHTIPHVLVITQLAGNSSGLSILSTYPTETGRSVQSDNTCLHWALQKKSNSTRSRTEGVRFPMHLSLMDAKKREKKPCEFPETIFGVLLLPCCSFHGTFSQEIYQPLTFSNLLTCFIETDKEGKMLPEKVGAVGYFYNGPFHKHKKDMISQFSCY